MPAATPFLILLGGELSPGPRLAAQIEGARVIAADGGMRHAATLGLVPELWVGDFDSSDTALKARFSGVERVEHPVAKDMTDGELAIDQPAARAHARARRRGQTRNGFASGTWQGGMKQLVRVRGGEREA